MLKAFEFFNRKKNEGAKKMEDKIETPPAPIIPGYSSVFDSLPDTMSSPIGDDFKEKLKPMYEIYDRAWTIPDLYKAVSLFIPSLPNLTEQPEMKKQLDKLWEAWRETPLSDKRAKTLFLLDFIAMKMMPRMNIIEEQRLGILQERADNYTKSKEKQDLTQD